MAGLSRATIVSRRGTWAVVLGAWLGGVVACSQVLGLSNLKDAVDGGDVGTRDSSHDVTPPVHDASRDAPHDAGRDSAAPRDAGHDGKLDSATAHDARVDGGSENLLSSFSAGAHGGNCGDHWNLRGAGASAVASPPFYGDSSASCLVCPGGGAAAQYADFYPNNAPWSVQAGYSATAQAHVLDVADAMGEPADAASGVALVVLLPYKPDGGPLLAGNSMVNLPSQATWQLLNVSLAPAPDGGENVFPHVYVTGGCILIGDMGLYVSPPQ